MRSNRARSTFRILPLSGRIAWNLRSRPCLAEPPALSPSTMNSSLFAGSRSWQSASLPGNVETSSTPLRRVSSRALRAASRAAAASITFWMMPRASFGCVSNQCAMASAAAACTTGCTSLLTSFSFVCEENFGSGTFTDSTAVMPSRMSSPTSERLSFLPMPSAYFVTTRVSAWRKPARCVPPSRCGMLLVKHSIVSWKAVVPGQRELDADALRAVRRGHADRRREHRNLAAVEPFDERNQPAIVAEYAFRHRGVALVAQHDGQAGIEEGEFAQAPLEDRQIEVHLA